MVVGPEIDDGVFFKAQVFVEGIADLFCNKERTDDKDLGDDELENGERLAEPRRAGLAGIAVGLVLKHQDGFEAGKYEGGVDAGEEGYDEDQDKKECDDRRLPYQIEMKVVGDEVGEDLYQEWRQGDGKEGSHQGEDKGLGEELEDQLTLVAAHGLADTDLFCALRGLGGGQVDKVDTGQQQEEGGYGQETVEGRFMGLATFVENAVVEVEVNIAKGLQAHDHAVARLGFVVFVRY